MFVRKPKLTKNDRMRAKGRSPRQERAQVRHMHRSVRRQLHMLECCFQGWIDPQSFDFDQSAAVCRVPKARGFYLCRDYGMFNPRRLSSAMF